MDEALSPRQWHKWLIKEHFDIEISYLEGPSARIISGCTDATTKLISWIHVEHHTMSELANHFVVIMKQFVVIICFIKWFVFQSMFVMISALF